MKNSTFFLILALVVIAILSFVLFKECEKVKPEIGYIRDSIQYWKNREGHVVASLKQREDDFAVSEKGYLDSIAKLHNTKTKYIRDVVTITQRIKDTIYGEGKTHVVYVDDTSGRIKSVSEIFSSPYYIVQANIDLVGTGSFAEVETFDTLRLLTKEVKEGGLFNRKRYLQVDVVNSNPHAHIEGLKVYRQPLPKPKKFGIGIIGGYGIGGNDFTKPTVFVGVGVSYSLIRF